MDRPRRRPPRDQSVALPRARARRLRVGAGALRVPPRARLGVGPAGCEHEQAEEFRQPVGRDGGAGAGGVWVPAGAGGGRVCGVGAVVGGALLCGGGAAVSGAAGGWLGWLVGWLVGGRVLMGGR